MTCNGLAANGGPFATLERFLAGADAVSKNRGLAVFSDLCFLIGSMSRTKTKKLVSLGKLVCIDHQDTSHQKLLQVEAGRPSYVLFDKEVLGRLNAEPG